MLLLALSASGGRTAAGMPSGRLRPVNAVVGAVSGGSAAGAAARGGGATAAAVPAAAGGAKAFSVLRTRFSS